MARILVTGGAGFLGSHLCERLLGLGHSVMCVDNLLTGTHDNIAHFSSRDEFDFLHHDVTEAIDFEADLIFNLACPASPVHYQRDPVATVRTSVLGALNMLEIAKRHGSRIIQASTSEVYGDPEVHPQKESYWGRVNPIGIRSCYDEGKRCAETLFFDYHRQYGVDIKVMRIFNTYGPRMRPDDGRVIGNFVIQALKNEPISIYGDGSQTRSFCYVDDMINAFIALMDSAHGFSGPVNIGRPVETSIRDLAEKIIAMTGSSSTLDFRTLPGDDPRQRKPDISLAKDKLGWEPKVAFDDGLVPTIEWFRSRLQ